MLTHRAATPELPPRVVVLGGSGFVGQAVVRQLLAQEVEAVPVSSRDLDLCAAEAVAGLHRIVRPGDALVIAAAITPDHGKDSGTLLSNLSMGQHVSVFLRQAALAHVVYISSDAVYDERTGLIRETTPPSPTSFHGLMHLVRERMLLDALRGSKAPLAILRPSLLYGAEDTHNGYGPNQFLRSTLQSGTITLFGGGEERRDHLCIRDLARLVSLCLMSGSEGILNVATGRSVSFAEAARLVAEVAGDEVRIECVPRRAPVTHRHFETTERVLAFPSFRCTSLRLGLAETLHALRGDVLEAKRS